MAFTRYIAEEIAADAADGFITRREALRRLALLGLGAGAASVLLAACGDGDDTAEPGPTTTTLPGGEASLITFRGPRVQLRAAFAAPAGDPKGSVLVIHENRGLTDHFQALPGRLAGTGYTALAVDLLSEEGGTASFADPARATAALSAAPRQRLVDDMRASVDELERRAPDKRIGAMGFCFGGAMIWELLVAPEPRLAAAVPFYGPLPDGADFSGSTAAVLAIYAERDRRVNATRQAATEALQGAGLVHEVRTFPGVDHAFFNETGPRYDADAAGEAYREVLDWFDRHVATG